MPEMDFLKDFEKRMRSVGRYSVLISNSLQKTTWKQYGVDSADEQINMIFTVLLYIMEYSLKEEDCTIDDIAGFIGEVNDLFYKRDMGIAEYREMADFVVNIILSNSGSAMYFKSYNYEKKEYEELNISYIANKVVYQENGVRRTSYYLTEEGYNMMLSTMELENNLKLTVHEMLFKMHLEKADYNRAVHDIKNVFDQLRIQNQKIQEAMHRIRKNALMYTIEEYKQIVEENINTIERTRQQFRMHREYVDERVKEFEDNEINADTFTDKERENLDNLRTISSFLNKSLDEHQKILNEHFDLKSLYDIELENYSNMTMVQRFSFRSELYDKVLDNVSLLENIHIVMNPLFLGQTDKRYNPNKAFEYQKKIRKDNREDEVVELGFDGERYREEKEREKKERLNRYYKSIRIILEELFNNKNISLGFLSETVVGEKREKMIPTAEIFREIMIEFLTAGVIDIEVLEKERSEYLAETADNFHLNEMILRAVEDKRLSGIKKIYIRPAEKQSTVYFHQVNDEYGNVRSIKCSNVEMWYE